MKNILQSRKVMMQGTKTNITSSIIKRGMLKLGQDIDKKSRKDVEEHHLSDRSSMT